MSIVDELRKRPYADDTVLVVGSVTCPSCGTANEQFKTLCYSCGSRLTPRATAIKLPSQSANYTKAWGMRFVISLIWAILVVGFGCCVCVVAGNLGNITDFLKTLDLT